MDEGSYGVLDKLSLAYEGNRLMSVSDDADSEPTYQDAFHYQDNSSSAGEFAYDENGNMTKYLDKNISKIEYNCFNLPLKVTFTDGSTINYVYNAMGQKLSSTARINKLAAMMPITTVMQGNNDRSGLIATVTTYRGNFIYVDGKLSMVLFSGGYVDMTGSSPKYRYYLQDHLGSTRVVADANANVLQENSYYALGGLMSDQCVNVGVQPYKYNGKELNRMHGMDFYDYGARWYDAGIGRWTAVDPLSEKDYDISPYVYCHDNPVGSIDHDGRSTWVINQGNGKYQVVGGNLNDKDKNIYVGFFNKKKRICQGQLYWHNNINDIILR